jgi:ABC-2 type transport system permease protein
MKAFYEAFRTESLKAFRSKIFLITILVFTFISVMIGLLVYFSMHPDLLRNSALMSAKATILGQSAWLGYFGLLYQLAAMLGMIGFGFVTGWVFGREYSDRTVTDLLALPVSRSMIVAAKFIVTVIWSFLLALVMFILGIASGLLIGLENWSGEAASHAFRIFMNTSALTILLSFPVAFFASWGKGYLLPIGYIILTMIMTQFIVSGIPGLAAYFPWAIPGLYCGAAGPGGPGLITASWIILGMTGIAGLAGTLAWWRYADQT